MYPGGVQTGQVKEEQEVHSGQINDIRFSADGTHFVTAARDMTSKLIDTVSLEVRSRLLPCLPLNIFALYIATVPAWSRTKP